MYHYFILIIGACPTVDISDKIICITAVVVLIIFVLIILQKLMVEGIDEDIEG